MRVEFGKDCPRITGSFSEIAQLKSYVLNLPDSPRIVNQGNNYIEVSINTYLIAKDEGNFTFEVSQEAWELFRSAEQARENHKNARLEVYEKFASNAYLTGDLHWDEL